MSFINSATTTFNQVRNLYHKKKLQIENNPNLTERGKAEALEGLYAEMRHYWNTLVEEYNLQMTLVNSQINDHAVLKPKPASPVEDAEQNRSFKLLLNRFAMADTLKQFLGILEEVNQHGSDAEKAALMVNYAQVITMGKELLPPVLEGREQDAAALKAQYNGKLQSIYKALGEGIKTDKEVKWETKLNELQDAKDTLKAEYNTAQRIFSKNFQDQFGISLEPAPNALNVWK